MKKLKKGYALLTTVVVMVFIMTISTILLSIVVNQSKKNNMLISYFENNLVIEQYAQFYADTDKGRFIRYFTNLEKVETDIYLDEINKLKITFTTDTESNQIFSLSGSENDKVYVKITKDSSNQILEWKKG